MLIARSTCPRRTAAMPLEISGRAVTAARIVAPKTTPFTPMVSASSFPVCSSITPASSVTADAAAKIVVQNALFFPTKKLSSLTMPWCTYTDPEIAHVGMYERDASTKGISIDTYTIPLHENEGIEWIFIEAERVVDVAVVVGVPSGREQHPIQPNPASLVIHLVLVSTARGDFDRYIELKGFHCHSFRGRRCRPRVDDLCVG